MSIYTEQAEQFLKDCNAILEIEYDGHDYYFDDDKTTRDIYKCTLKRNKKQYSFSFGQSIADTENGREPSAYDILACLTKYKPEGDVWDFANEVGYTINSRESFERVNKIFRAVCREWRNVKRLFGDVLDPFREIN